MARKNLLSTVVQAESPNSDDGGRHDYAWRGASRSMRASIDEMAENAKKMLLGEAVVQLDAELLDGSFLTDRLGDDEDDFDRLKNAIQENGQSSPILVRPHPRESGRFMIVFGHRRARAARELGIPVLAVVKQLEDIGHVIAQGQENAARSNLSFIEKSLLAKRLLDMGQEKQVIKTALTIDDTLLSRMLAIVEVVPLSTIEFIGTAKPVGRDRWESFKKLLLIPENADQLGALVETAEGLPKDGAVRFNYLFAALIDNGHKRRRKVAVKATPGAWLSEDKRVKVAHHIDGKSYAMAFGAEHAVAFGAFVVQNLEGLYRQFKTAQSGIESGDG